MCFVTLFIKKGESSEDIEDYEGVMREVASKYVTHFNIKASRTGKRLTLHNLCEIRKQSDPDGILKKMIEEINEKTNGTAGGWLCEKKKDLV